LRSQGGWKGVKLFRETGNYLKGDDRILGEDQFMKEILQKPEKGFKKKYQLKAKGDNLNKLVKRVAVITQ
jgi:putative transposase